MLVGRKWILAGGVAALAGLLVVAALRNRPTGKNRRDCPVNFAHRGASARRPENTLVAFREAVAAGSGGLELDVHMTRDGRIVVIHDDTVDRTTDGTGCVRDMTLAEVRRLDAGYRFTDDGTRTYRDRGLRVPTLEEVFEEFPDRSVNVEIKEDLPGIERAVLRTIREAGAGDRTLVAAQRHAVMRRFREVSGGEVPTSASGREIRVFFLLNRLRLTGLLSPAYDALQVPVRYRGVRVLTPRFVRAAHDLGVRVDAWTVDDPCEMGRLLDMGVDVVMTNCPERLQEVLQQRREV